MVMRKHHYHFLGAGNFHRHHQRNWGWGSAGLFTYTVCQIKLLPVCLHW
ncbi:hypothetical protein GXM_02395 [Nostoc sphaeroides CCNUC1]|uniref:Uncharacterized protein n=1 Tax=Nostoc sphaeroides CCNUC1 TaxID=2653204 RepID=A0A5P8VX13_9NOSO|nr:hypothetical protein GXM_02395 [Nostoc sphaeroides CCNUC1]